MKQLLLISITIIFCHGIQIRTSYSEIVSHVAPHRLLQNVTNTIYLDGKAANTLAEPQYITVMQEIEYLDPNEQQVASVMNFRNLNFFSMVNNSQKNVPNFRNLLKLRKIQIKSCDIEKIDSISFSNVGALEVLDLQKNKISEIENRAFGKKIHSVDLKCNRLTSVSPGWFRNASSLEWFNLESNKIEILQENLFKKFVNLRELYLARNELLLLEPGSISGPINMHILDLGINDLSVINSDVFSENRVFIRNIRISFNRLSFLKNDLMEKVTITNNSIIYGNPWQCPCMKSIRDWLPASNVNSTVRNEASCVFTPEKSKECHENASLNNELYNHYISEFEVVDVRNCSKEAINFDPKIREILKYYNWLLDEEDIR